MIISQIPDIRPHYLGHMGMFRRLKSVISKRNIVATYDLVYNAAQFVKKGFGYVIALDKLINTTGDSDLCFRPLYPTLEAGLCIVWKKYQVFSKASNAFLQQLQKELENIVQSNFQT